MSFHQAARLPVFILLFLSGLLLAQISSDGGVFIDFENADLQLKGLPKMTVAVTRNRKEVVFGKSSLKGSSLNSSDEETVFFSTPPGLLKKGEDVEIQLSYRTLELGDKEAYFFLRVRSQDNTNKKSSFSTWRGSAGFIGQVEIPVRGIQIDRDDFQIEIGIRRRASIAVDNLSIQPKAQPRDAGIVLPGTNTATNIAPITIVESPKNPPAANLYSFSQTNCDCEDRDGLYSNAPPRAHERLTISSVYDTPLRNSYLRDLEDKTLKNYFTGMVDTFSSRPELDAFEPTRKLLYLHIKEWFCDQDFKQFDNFFKGSDPNMVLRAEGKRPVNGRVNVRNGETTWFAEDCRNIREVVFSISLADYIRMTPGVPYRLTPRNVWNDHKWQVAADCYFIRSPNEDAFPDHQRVSQKLRDEELMRYALELEAKKNYLGALIQLGAIPAFSPLAEEAREAIKRIRAKNKLDIDDDKKKETRPGF